jgi:multidrug resistance efflux pump
MRRRHSRKGKHMKRIDQWKAKLRAAKSELRHKTRQLNAAQRTHARTTKLIEQLEKKIELHMAKT